MHTKNAEDLINKYNDYTPRHTSLSDAPGGKQLMGILENESLMTIFRVFSCTENYTSFDIWDKVFDRVQDHLHKNGKVCLDDMMLGITKKTVQ